MNRIKKALLDRAAENAFRNGKPHLANALYDEAEEAESEVLEVEGELKIPLRLLQDGQKLRWEATLQLDDALTFTAAHKNTDYMASQHLRQVAEQAQLGKKTSARTLRKGKRVVISETNKRLRAAEYNGEYGKIVALVQTTDEPVYEVKLDNGVVTYVGQGSLKIARL